MTSSTRARAHRSSLRASDVARLGLTGLRSRPMRAVLSALGIAIGIAAMVGVVGVSASSQAQLQEQLRALGTNMLTARSGADLSGTDLILPEDSVGRTLMIPGVTSAASTSTLSGVSVYRSRLSDPNATGGIITMAADTNLLEVVSGQMKHGVWLNDATARYPGVVLGSKAAQLLGVVEPGTQVWLGGRSFTVLGVMEHAPLAEELDNTALIGIPGLVFYLSAVHFGFSKQVVPSTLDDAWWEIIVLLIWSAANAFSEEIVVVMWLLTRLQQLRIPPWVALLLSAVLRGSYHLYQGWSAGLGNIIMGLIFGAYYLKTRRVWPLILGHFLIDAVAFVGYSLLRGHLSFLGL